MRPQQQNRRMRGRGNNNNRKGPNPLTRNYESNGPDVKIRGSAQQIAEKYTSLARDAQSSGDRVMAENYLQHAEHYNRIIAAAQAQMPAQNFRENRDDDFDDEEREEAEAGGVNGTPAGQPNQRPSHNAANGNGPQPVIEGMPAEVAYRQDELAQPPVSEQPHEHVNGNGAVNGAAAEESVAAAEGEEAPRRARRPRRPRKRDEAGEGEAPVVADAQAPEAVAQE